MSRMRNTHFSPASREAFFGAKNMEKIGTCADLFVRLDGAVPVEGEGSALAEDEERVMNHLCSQLGKKAGAVPFCFDSNRATF